MNEAKTFPVYDETGCIGVLLASARFLDPSPEKTIRLNNGEEIRVPGSALKVQPDGSFRLLRTPPSNAPESRPEPAQPAPLSRNAAEPAPSGTAPQLSVNMPTGSFFQDDYDIERVAIGRVVDGPVTHRQEGNTLVLPVVEEVLVYEKKLYLREEIRITRRRRTVEEVKRIEQKPK